MLACLYAYLLNSHTAKNTTCPRVRFFKEAFDSITGVSTLWSTTTLIYTRLLLASSSQSADLKIRDSIVTSVSFFKGAQVCLAINLAYAEFSPSIACIFREYGSVGGDNPAGVMELYETTKSDVEIESDWFAPTPRLDTKGIRIVLK